MSTTYRALLALTVAITVPLGCTKKPPVAAKPPTPKARPSDPDPAAARPRVPPPQGPDIASQMILRVDLGPLGHWDRHMAKLAQSAGAPAGAQRLFTDQIVGGIAKMLRFSPYLVDAIDKSRSAHLAVTLRPDAASGGVMALMQPKSLIRVVALLPVAQGGKLMIDALKSTFPDTTPTPWGGWTLRRAGETVAVAGLRQGYLAIAPDGPWVDSAVRLLHPFTKQGARGFRMRLDFQKIWKPFGPLLGGLLQMVGVLGGGFTLPPSLTQAIGPLFTALTDHLAGLESIEASLEPGAQQWSGRLRIRAVAGSKLEQLFKRQPAAGAWGLDVLPDGAILASSDAWSKKGRNILTTVESIAWALYWFSLKRKLPLHVEQRGLFKGKTAVSRRKFATTMRDFNYTTDELNKVYDAYSWAMQSRALRGRFRQFLQDVFAVLGPRVAGAVYAKPSRGLSAAFVQELADPRAALRLAARFAQGTLSQMKRFFAGIWPRMLPASMRSALQGKNPFTLTYKPRLARAGGVTISGLTLSIRWPNIPPTAPRRLRRLRRLLTVLLGASGVTLAWAPVQQQLVGVLAEDWKPLLLSAIKRAQNPAAGAPSVARDPLFTPAIAHHAAAQPSDGQLTLGLLSVGRLIQTTVDRGKRIMGARAGGRRSKFLAAMRAAGQASTTGSSLHILRAEQRLDVLVRSPTSELALLLRAMLGVLMAGGSKSTVSPPPTPATPSP